MSWLSVLCVTTVCFSLWNSGVVVILLLYVDHQQSSQTALCLFPTWLLSFLMWLLLFWGHWLIDNTLMKNLAYVPVYLVLWCSSSHDLIGLPFCKCFLQTCFLYLSPCRSSKISCASALSQCATNLHLESQNWKLYESVTREVVAGDHQSAALYTSRTWRS